MNIARETGAARKQVRTPRYVEIMRALRQDIVAGVVPIGQNLPSEAELCRRFDSSRFTVREALRRLQDDGLVERTQGAGSRVVATQPGGVLVQHYRSVDELNQYARDTWIEVMTQDTVVLDARTAGQVGGSQGEPWAFFRARRFAPGGGAPLCLLESYMPLRMQPHLPDPAAAVGPIYGALSKAAGEPVIEATQDTQALPMPGRVSEALGQARGAVSLRILRRYASAQGTLIATFNWHLGGERYVHRTNLSLQDKQF
ncbi:GntR family transcriptional regulator [Oceaniglobus ichthyenteri]|uniref:GntR family transcriptional regulator n=1 Tax=Oceaniglobus ichthyenteri TaxID=2136177 RepID=UPI000D3D24B0|nr:GntR family transcriptional regulator [Oceaniglobus ichthyenteri]